MQFTYAVKEVAPETHVQSIVNGVGETRIVVNNPSYPEIGFLLAFESGGHHRWKMVVKLADKNQSRPQEDWYRLVCVGTCCGIGIAGKGPDRKMDKKVGARFRDEVARACQLAGIKVLLVRNASGWEPNFGLMGEVDVEEGNQIFEQAKHFCPDVPLETLFPFIDFQMSALRGD